jgi:hypothetical protein
MSMKRFEKKWGKKRAAMLKADMVARNHSYPITVKPAVYAPIFTIDRDE